MNDFCAYFDWVKGRALVALVLDLLIAVVVGVAIGIALESVRAGFVGGGIAVIPGFAVAWWLAPPVRLWG